MQKVSELMSSRIGSTLANIQTWGDILYNVKSEPFSATGDGTTDDTVAVQLCITTAISEGREAIYFPHGTYVVTALTDDDQVVFFGDNSTFTGGYTGTINQIGFSPSLDPATANLDMASFKIVNLGTPSSANDAARKTDVDSLVTTGVKRNSLININFAVNNRVVSGTVVLAAGAYGHDRWKAGASGCTYTFATALNVTTITITAGSLIQTIEGTSLSSGTYTLSWTGTAQGKIGAGSYGATGTTGTAVGGTNLTIEFNTGTLSQVQLNAGATALPFQPKSVPQEQIDCNRYLFTPGNFGTLAGYKVSCVGPNQLFFLIPLPVAMRTTPTIINNTESTYWNVRNPNSTAVTGFTLSVQSFYGSTLIISANKTAHGLDSTYYLSSNSNLFGFEAEI